MEAMKIQSEEFKDRNEVVCHHILKNNRLKENITKSIGNKISESIDNYRKSSPLFKYH